jgi:uncharacterized protein (TIGR01244 family)
MRHKPRNAAPPERAPGEEARRVEGDPHDITAWQRIDARTTTSGRLRPNDPARLAAIGVRRVINLALDESPGALPGEAALTAAVGLGYTHIPVPFDAPTEAHYAQFRATLGENDAPVHVHCIMNWRVSAFFYRLHREQGMADPEARTMMEVQWDPDTIAHKDAPAWARFIHGEE